MKTLHLATLSLAGIISVISFGIYIISNPIVATPVPLNSTDYDMQRIYTFCTNPTLSSQGSDLFVTCNHSQNYTANGPIIPPLPVYKRIECHSPFGCSGKYIYELQTPDNFLTQDQKQQVIERTLQATGLNKYQDIQFESMSMGVHNDHWFEIVDFVIPHIEYTNGNCGWQVAASVDLNDFHVDYDFGDVGNNKC